jgi:hypothetical protein
MGAIHVCNHTTDGLLAPRGLLCRSPPPRLVTRKIETSQMNPPSSNGPEINASSCARYDPCTPVLSSRICSRSL